jgi:hypothetical protein
MSAGPRRFGSFSAFVANYSPVANVDYVRWRKASVSAQESMKLRYTGRTDYHRDSLLWKAIAPKADMPLMVAKTKTLKRMRRAIKEILEEKGYLENGMRSSAAGPVPGLVGTLILVAKPESVLMNYFKLRDDVRLAVNAIESGVSPRKPPKQATNASRPLLRNVKTQQRAFVL